MQKEEVVERIVSSLMESADDLGYELLVSCDDLPEYVGLSAIINATDPTFVVKFYVRFAHDGKTQYAVCDRSNLEDLDKSNKLSWTPFHPEFTAADHFLSALALTEKNVLN